VRQANPRDEVAICPCKFHLKQSDFNVNKESNSKRCTFRIPCRLVEALCVEKIVTKKSLKLS
jgi:hypothetical protein